MLGGGRGLGFVQTDSSLGQIRINTIQEDPDLGLGQT